MAKTGFTADKEKREVVVTRVFECPRELIWKAYTDPEMIPKWWGPAKYSTRVDKMDAREGGMWRFVHSDSSGKEYAFHGIYREMSKPERIVSTFVFEGAPGKEIIDTLTLEDLGEGKTLYASRSAYESIKDFEGMISSGMESGMRESLDRLAKLVEGGSA